MNQPYAIAVAFPWVLGDFHNRLPAAFAGFAQAAAPVAIAAMWQGAAIALGMALFLRLAPRITAAQRFAAWATSFAVVAGLPFLPVFSQGAAGAGIAGGGLRPWFEIDDRWAIGIVALWLAIAAFRVVELALHSIRLRRLWNSAMPIEDSDLASGLIGSLSAGRAVRICTTRELDRPSVIGFFAPRVLIPEWLIDRLTPEELEQVVLHEAEHLRRWDDWTNLAQKICLVFFPLNPALAWIDRRLSRERELACDEGVVARTRAPRAYAAFLTSLAERGLQRDLERRAEALSLAAWRRGPELGHRVYSILRRKQTLHPVAARAVLGVAACGLMLGSVELARCPQAVAFVAAPGPQPLDIAKLQPELTPAADEAQRSNGFRTIPAKAILPTSALAPTANGDAPRYGGGYDATRQSELPAKNAEAAGPRKQLIKATMPSAFAEASDQDSGQISGGEYIVLTAWEQVETAPHRSREMADYDTEAAAQQGPGQASDTPSADAPVQVSVTRLILRIYPANSAPGVTRNSQAPRVPDSNSDQPAAVPLDGGWLVFRL